MMLSVEPLIDIAKLRRVKWVAKGWGGEQWLANEQAEGSDGYCGKRLLVVAGYRFSYHYHKIKDEVFYIQSGKCVVKYAPSHRQNCDNLDFADSIILEQGQRFHIPVGMRHQVIALNDTWIIESSTHHDDADSYRLVKGD